MLRHERLSAVVELVVSRGTLSVDEVSDVFEVSAATARRDLDDLAAQQLITRTRGGAVAHTVSYDLPLRYKSSRRPDQKRRIAAAAAGLVETGTVIGLNGGTTNTEVARSVATRADLANSTGSALASLTVVTNALNIAHELAVRPTMKVVVIGGVLRPQSFELIGPFARRVLDDVTIDLTFLGVDALDPDSGAAAAHEGEAQINSSMVERSRRVVAVADSSKLGQRAFCTICDVGRIDTLITDAGADDSLLARFRDRGVEVVTV
ncbi:MAG: DeoR/GlpR transcriptional regulator [Actinobacteria bacterium]|nr:DeoR/GlpR transcriptional regulator [Actinomycetota bacterium]